MNEQNLRERIAKIIILKEKPDKTHSAYSLDKEEQQAIFDFVQAERSRLAAMAPEGALLTDFDMITALDEPCVAFSDPRLIQWRAITKAQLAAVWTIFQAKIEQAVKVERERAIQEVGELVDEYIGGGNYRVYVPNWKATVGGISADLEYVWGELKKAIEALKSGKQEAKS